MDASAQIGSGHVYRCAALARLLAGAGHDVRFLCRELSGNLEHMLASQGFAVDRVLPDGRRECMEEQDAVRCREMAGDRRHDWLIVDHYGLGARWEIAMADVADRIFAIDDLGREHHCHLLLDQNMPNPAHRNYPSRVPSGCEVLAGPEFALLRPEFAAHRIVSLARPRGAASRLLVFMGAGDANNETTKVLDGIARMKPQQPSVEVVIGTMNPHRYAVEAACSRLSKVTLHVQTTRIAELMASADCAIGAPGSSTWERCTLGLPALVTIMAENQASVGEAVHAAGGHRLLGWYHEVSAEAYAHALHGLDAASLSRMSDAAANICDGGGAARVAERLMSRPN